MSEGQPQEDPPGGEYDYNLIVIGGGSAGLAVAKEAAALNKRVLLIDCMAPVTKGTKWNAISKKLMHQAAFLGQSLKDSSAYGWRLQQPVSHDWCELMDGLQQRTKSLSFDLRVELRKLKTITYLNARAELLDSHTVQATDADGDKTSHTAETIVVATGDKPHYPDIPGAKEHCITCEDLFSLPYCPGRTLVVGDTGEALEAAGWLFGLGVDVSIMHHPSPPEGHDQKMLSKIVNHMFVQGVTFLHGYSLTKVEQIETGRPGKLKVTANSPELDDVLEEQFNTVLLSLGRDPCTQNVGLERAGVQINQRTGEIVVSDEDRTSVSHIYAIGAVQEGRPSHSGLSMQAGRLLAHRLYGGKNTKCNYSSAPIVLYTSMEYAACGLTEEAACQRFGESNITVFHSYYWPQEWTLPRRNKNSCYAKVICHITDNHLVLGVHVMGPSAGEIIQGFATALRCGLTKEQLDATIGLHPLCAEVLTNLTLTQRDTDAMMVRGNC